MDSVPSPSSAQPSPSQPSNTSGPAPLLSPLRVLATVCVVAPIIAVLWIPSYNQMSPKVLGFPFFYWYQLLWVVLTALLMAVAYFAVRRDEANRRGRNGAGS